MTLRIDIEAVSAIIRDVAATEIMPRFGKLTADDMTMKPGAAGPVTIADQEAERVLSQRLKELLPGSVVFGEEAFARDPDVLKNLHMSAPLWIIDPIDGTKSFIAHEPFFGVMVALAVKQQVIAGWIYHPISGDMLTAEAGGGAWLGDQKMQLAAEDITLPQLGLCGGKISRLPDIIKASSADLTEAEQKLIPLIKLGKCSVFDYARMLTGQRLFANSEQPRASFLLYRRTETWDHAPGSLIMQEVGAYSADWAGEPYNIKNTMHGLLHARDKYDWQRLRQQLEPFLSQL